MNALFSQASNAIIGIATSGTDVYFLNETSSSTFALEKVETTGTPTILATTSTATWKDIAVAGNYLFILQTIASANSVIRYPLSEFSIPSPPTLALPGNSKRFASDGGAIVYICGTTLARGIMYFDGSAFTTVSAARTAAVYTGLTSRSVSINSISFGYLYGTRGSAGSGQIDKIPVSSLNASVASPVNVTSAPTEVITPNLIKRILQTSSFVITDQNGNGSLGGGTTNGQIHSYAPTFDSTTGALSLLGAGTRLIRGNSNSGSMEIVNTTSLPSNTLSTDSSAYLYQALAFGYNITAGGFINLFAGNGGTGLVTGYLVKFCDSVAGSPIGGL